jgi:hypothetical protein
MFNLKNFLCPAGLVWSRQFARLDLLGIKFEDEAGAAARLPWRKVGYSGAQFDQPLGENSDEYAA